jgi:hypothetical protein
MTEQSQAPTGGPDPASGPETLPSFVYLAEAYRDEGLLEDAIRVLTDGLTQHPESAGGAQLLAEIRARQTPDEGDLILPPAEAGEADLLFLEGESDREAPPLASPMLAALYAAHGDADRAQAVVQVIEPARSSGELATHLEAALDGVRDARAAWILGADGSEAARAERPGFEPAAAADCARIVREARELAEMLDLGRAQSVRIVGPAGCRVMALLADGRAIGLEGGPESLAGQMAQRARDAARDLPGGSGAVLARPTA